MNKFIAFLTFTCCGIGVAFSVIDQCKKGFKYILCFLLLFFSTMAFSQAPAQPKPDKLTVILDWFPNPSHAPLFVAQEQGFFKQQNLDVKLLGPADPDDPPKLVAAGHADLALTYEPQLMIDVDRGLPLIQVGTLIATPLTSLAVLETSSIKQLADLKGKRIGYSSPSSDLPVLAVMLKQANLTLKDVNLINVHYDLTQALLSKKVDAVIGMGRNFELIQMAQSGHPARAFYPENLGVPNYSELVIIANKKEVNDTRLSRFMIALQEATLYLINHPEETWLTFAKEHPELNNTLNHTSWTQTLPRFALRPAIYDPIEYQRFATFLKEQGVIKKVEPSSDYAVVLPH